MSGEFNQKRPKKKIVQELIEFKIFPCFSSKNWSKFKLKFYIENIL